MTVSTIGNAALELRRAQENQNRTTTSPELARARQPASLPTDRVTASIQPPVAPELLSYQEAIVQTQAQNLDALRSSLSDDDMAALTQAKPSPQETVQAQAKASMFAQTNKLPANLLQLLNE